ncbi:MAG: phospholipase D-like domain-containing protein [Verrucomicrobiota bacterium]
MKLRLRLIPCLAVVVVSGCHGPSLQLKHPIADSGSVTDPVFYDSLAGQLRTGFLPGNKIEPLLNGDQILPAMIAAIRTATNSINLESYIWKSGRMSDAFIEALTERARAGVEVRCLADGLGTLKLKDEDEQRLRDGGVKYFRYNKPRLYLPHRVNYRDHRKLMIVDGRVGFTGGACIADAWLGNAETKEVWRDSHFRVEGPSVAQIQGIFSANWLKTQGEMLTGEKFYPTLTSHGGALAQNFASGRQDGGETARIVYLSAIGAARKHIHLEHAYLVPDELAMEALLKVRERGVEIEVITAGATDSGLVKSASKTLWPELLRAGVKIYEYHPAMLHCKILIVDDAFVSCGSVNFDARSFDINDESNMNVIDAPFTARMIADFEHDKAQSKPITLADVKQVPWYKRGFEWFTSLFRQQL